MSLEQWERNTWLKRVTPSLREVFDLIEIAERAGGIRHGAPVCQCGEDDAHRCG
jgi:hypothetical protein